MSGGQSRRDVLRRGAWLGAGALLLPADARPTPHDGSREEYVELFGRAGHDGAIGSRLPVGGPVQEPSEPTPSDVLGPFWRSGSPFRGKTTRPLAAGRPLLVQGRVWSFEQRRPIAGVLVDVWHAGDNGRYRDDEGEVLHRIRLRTDEQGAYEYEAVLPGHYDTRPRHIHYRLEPDGHAELITQLYFEGDPRNAEEGVDERLIVPIEHVESEGGTYGICRFDLVLPTTDED